ncbi:MAG: hypothetical protein ACRC68_15230, partial [Clostridium sp.]
MINELKELIASVEYTYGLTLNINYLNNTSSVYESLLEKEKNLSFKELMYTHYLAGLCHDHLYNDDKALYHFKLCLYYSIELDNQLFIGKCYLYISKYYFTSSDFDRYCYCFNKAEDIFSSLKNYCDLSKLYILSISYKVKLASYTGDVLLLIPKTLDALTKF